MPFLYQCGTVPGFQEHRIKEPGYVNQYGASNQAPHASFFSVRGGYLSSPIQMTPYTSQRRALLLCNNSDTIVIL